jgi:hypothetical protein
MAPIIEVSDESLNAFNQLGLKYKLRKDLENSSLKSCDKYIHIPSLNLDFSKERTLQFKNWYETHRELQSNGLSMPTPMEFLESLKYIKDNFPQLYKEITEVRNPWRANWLDADFKVKGKNLYINYNHVLDSSGNLIPKNSEILDKNTLMKDKTPGISLDDYILENHTSQGLPNKKVKSGDLYYFNPRSDNNSVVRFSADSDRAYLNCNRYPSNWGSVLGVYAVKRE